MPLKRLTEYLDTNKIKYATITHAPAFTAQQVAESAHIKGRDMAKTLIVKLDGKLAMVVLPADAKLDLEALKVSTGVKRIELANEHEFKDKFPGCEVGAMPPFGNLFGMDVYVDKCLAIDNIIAFNAGNHSEVIKLSYEDYVRLVHPVTWH